MINYKPFLLIEDKFSS